MIMAGASSKYTVKDVSVTHCGLLVPRYHSGPPQTLGHLGWLFAASPKGLLGSLVYVINELVTALSVAGTGSFHFGEQVKISDSILVTSIISQLCIHYIYRFPLQPYTFMAIENT